MSLAIPSPTRWPRLLLRSFTPTPNSLLSPAADIFMAGGASIVLYIAFFTLVSKDASTHMFGWATYYLSFLVNYPHFAASYQILYGDNAQFFANTKHAKHSARVWWAGVIAPLALIGYLAYAYDQQSEALMGYTVNAMFFLVGWHYVKQIFGCVIVLSAAKKMYFSAWERRGILAPLFMLWILSFVNANTYGYMNVYHGVSYTSFTLTDRVIPGLYCFLGLATLVFLGMLVQRYRTTKQTLPLSAWAAFISIYLWYIPTISHPHFFLIIPFFHSLQYLLFVTVYKKNQCLDEQFEEEIHGHGDIDAEEKSMGKMHWIGWSLFILIPIVVTLCILSFEYINSLEAGIRTFYTNHLLDQPRSWWAIVICGSLGSFLLLRARPLAKKNAIAGFSLFLIQAIVLGAILFSLGPVVLDIFSTAGHGTPAYDTTIFGTTLFMFMFTIFVNIHHYFVDNVIWRKDNPLMNKYLKGK